MTRKFWTSLILLIAGYLVLYMVDAEASNWAAALAPPLLIGGYALMGWSIYLGALGGKKEYKG